MKLLIQILFLFFSWFSTYFKPLYTISESKIYNQYRLESIKTGITILKVISCYNPQYTIIDPIFCVDLSKILNDQLKDYTNTLGTSSTNEQKYLAGKWVWYIGSFFIGAGEARTALKTGIEATKIASYLSKAKTLGSVKYLQNIITAGLKATKSTANTLIFTTALNLEIFRYNSTTSNFIFKSALLKSNVVKVILKLDNIKYSTDISSTLKTATVEIVEASDGSFGWRLGGNGSLVRGINKTQFIETVVDFANGAKAQIADQAWDLWQQQKWSDLENLFNANNINLYKGNKYPPCDGFLSQNLSSTQLYAYRKAEFVFNTISLLKAGNVLLGAAQPRVVAYCQSLWDGLKSSPQFFKNLKTQYPLKYNSLKDYINKTISKNIDDIESGVVNSGGSIVNSADELTSFVAQNAIRSDINLDFVIKMTKGRRDLIESILLSTKEVVDGKNIQQLVSHFNIPNSPALNSLSNYKTRIWYHFKKSDIPNVINKNKTLEEQALQAFDLRNQYRTEARNFMSDRNLADFLEANEKNLIWENYKTFLQTDKGLSGNSMWNYIINSSTSGRDGVDALFKL